MQQSETMQGEEIETLMLGVVIVGLFSKTDEKE